MAIRTMSRRRFVGIDLGKRTYQMAIVGENGKVQMSNGKTYVEGRQKLYKKLRPDDIVALEAGTMAFVMAKEISSIVGCKVYVLNPYRLAVIYQSMKKTDKEDALKLAHILEDMKEERLPVVPIPSDQEIRRRKLLAAYRRAQQSRNRDINRLHGLFLASGITTKVRKDLAEHEDRVEAIKELNGLEREEADYLVECLKLHEGRIERVKRLIAEEAKGDEVIERLQEVPGVGVMIAFAFAAYIAAGRFENGGQVSNYLGLVPRVYMSGEMVRYGRITKRGNSYLRALLVEGAWALIRSKGGGKLKELYEYMTQEKSVSKKKSAVAVARRIGELLYTLMRDGSHYEKRRYVREKEKSSGEKLAQIALRA